MSFVFANGLGFSVSKSYNNPYDAFQNRDFKNNLCIVSDNHVIKILDNNLISIKWALSCAKHVLHIFEEQYPNDKRPRKAIEAASNWIRDPSEQNRKACIDVGDDTDIDIKLGYENYYVARAAFDTTKAVEETLYYTDYTNYASVYALYATASAAFASPNKSLEIKWQRKKLNQIVYEEVLVLLVRSQYHRINKKLVRKIPKELLEYIASFITG